MYIHKVIEDVQPDELQKMLDDGQEDFKGLWELFQVLPNIKMNSGGLIYTEYTVIFRQAQSGMSY
jgi:hypothetical protein